MTDTHRTLPATRSGIARKHLNAAARALGSLLLGAVAIFGAVLIFRQALLPLMDAVLHLDPRWLSAFRRAGILLAAVASYRAYVRWYEKRPASELRLQPGRLLLGGASGAALVGLPITALFALGAYEVVAFRGASPALLDVAAAIGIAALLEELVYRCLLFRILEQAWGTGVALVVQALGFALLHLGNVEGGGAADVAAMLASVTLLGLLWAGLFVLARNLWVVAANHAAWNFTIILSGVPLSGIEDWRAVAPLESRYAGPGWLTGGMFGPESSVLVMVSAAIAAVLVLRAGRRRGAFRLPQAPSRPTRGGAVHASG